MRYIVVLKRPAKRAEGEVYAVSGGSMTLSKDFVVLDDNSDRTKYRVPLENVAYIEELSR